MNQRFEQKKQIAILAAISSLALLSGCGRTPDSNIPPVGTVPAPVVPGAVVGGCIPLNTTTMIPFTATNFYFAGQRVVAGQIPQGQAAGQVLLGGGVPAVAGGIQFRGQRVDGTSIQLNMTAPYGGVTQPYMQPYPYPQGGQGMANGSGMVQVSPQIQQMLIQRAAQLSGGQVGGYPPFPSMGTYPAYPQPGIGVGVGTGACVSGLSFDLKVANTSTLSNWLYLGAIYFFLNGTQNGLALDL